MYFAFNAASSFFFIALSTHVLMMTVEPSENTLDTTMYIANAAEYMNEKIPNITVMTIIVVFCVDACCPSTDEYLF